MTFLSATGAKRATIVDGRRTDDGRTDGLTVNPVLCDSKTSVGLNVDHTVVSGIGS